MASYAFNGTDMGVEICQKLGLMGQNVRKVVITIPTDDVVLLEVTHIMTQDQGDGLMEVINKYHFKGDGKD